MKECRDYVRAALVTAASRQHEKAPFKKKKTNSEISEREETDVNEKTAMLRKHIVELEQDAQVNGHYMSAVAAGFIAYDLEDWDRAKLLMLNGIRAEEKEYGARRMSKALACAHFKLSRLFKREGNKEKSDSHLFQAAHGEYESAQVEVGKAMLMEGRVKDALVWIERAAQNEEPEAQQIIGEWYRTGNGPLVQSDDEALHWLSLSAKTGNLKSWNALLVLAEEKIQMNSCPSQLFDKLQIEAACVGLPGALFSLYWRCKKAQCPCVGKVALLRAAARLGHSAAMLFYGAHLLQCGPERKISEALTWLYACAKTSNTAALADRAKFCLGLGILILQGQGNNI